MSVSVVTITLNAAKALPLTIESVHQQSGDDREYLVVDGGSWDGTADVLARYDDCIDRVVHVEDAGIFHAMNAALDHCSGEYVLFLNAGDTLYGRDVLTRFMSQQGDEADVVYGNHVYVDGQRELLRRSGAFDATVRKLRAGCIDERWLSRIPAHQATFMRLDLLRELRFDTRYSVCADHDVLMRAHADGARMKYVDQTAAHYVGGGFSQRNATRLRLEWAALYRKYSDRPHDVDRFFFAEQTSPFPHETARTGIWLSGILAREDVGGRTCTWCLSGGFRLQAPDSVESTGLTIEGFNTHEAQKLAVFEDGRFLTETSIPVGSFVATLVFPAAVSPRSVLEFVPMQFGALSPRDPRQGCLAVAGFTFESAALDDHALTSGESIVVGKAQARRLARLLKAGWWNLEDDLVWSKAGAASLDLPLNGDVARVVLHVEANPFVEPGHRGVHVVVNGADIGIRPIDGSKLELALTEHLRAGERNMIVLRSVAALQPPGDSRLLGVSLRRIDVL